MTDQPVSTAWETCWWLTSEVRQSSAWKHDRHLLYQRWCTRVSPCILFRQQTAVYEPALHTAWHVQLYIHVHVVPIYVALAMHHHRWAVSYIDTVEWHQNMVYLRQAIIAIIDSMNSVILLISDESCIKLNRHNHMILGFSQPANFRAIRFKSNTWPVLVCQ